MFKIIVVSSKEENEDKFNPCAAFISKTKANEYIDNIKEEDPGVLFRTDIVNLEDIEGMKLWQIINGRCGNPKPEMVFYDKDSANSAIELLEYPKDSKLRERTIKGPEFINEFMDEHGIKFYKHYQVLFKENGDIDKSDPKSDTVEDLYTKEIGIVTGEGIIENDDPAAVRVSVYYTLDDPIEESELLNIAKIARTEYIHNKYDLEY